MLRPWTFGLVKPDAVANPIAIRWLLDALHFGGLAITEGCRLTLTHAVAAELYSEHRNAFYYGRLVRHMCSGPSVAMRLELRADATSERRSNASLVDISLPEDVSHSTEAIDRWRALLGPSKLFANIYLSKCAEFDQIKHRYLRQFFALSDTRNFGHGADSIQTLRREYGLFREKMKMVEHPELELFLLNAYTLSEEDYANDEMEDELDLCSRSTK